MNYEDLTGAQKEKLGKCETPEDVLELTKDEGYDLSEEELKAAFGGQMVSKGADWQSE